MMEEKVIFEKVLTSVEAGRAIYDDILKEKNFRYFSIELDCSKLDDIEPNEVTPRGQKYKLPQSVISYFFSQLHENDLDGFKINNCACLYFLEIISHTPDAVKVIYEEFDDNFHDRSKSAIYRNKKELTNILYVGKVKSNIGGRFSTHFGYAHPHIGGLQLKYWAKQVNLQLIVHVIAFDGGLGDFINPLELKLTGKLNPLIGKSK